MPYAICKTPSGYTVYNKQTDYVYSRHVTSAKARLAKRALIARFYKGLK